METRPGPAELEAAGVTWIHLLAPTTEEAQQLSSRFGWHPLDVEDVLSRRQRPKIDDYSDDQDGGGYLFAVLHFPVYDKASGRLNAGELDVFLGPDYLVTLPSVELRPVSLLFRRCAENPDFREQLLAHGSGRLLYEVLDDLYDYCFPILDKIGFKLEDIDEGIGEGEGARELVREIHGVKQEIISYRKIIKPQRPTLRQLERQVERFLPEQLDVYFDDIVDASERIWDLLDNYKEVVEALEDTNESLISHQQNDILYVLTIFSVVMLPLTFLTGFFGMNVHFPGINTWDAFFGSIGLMALAIVAMLAFFRWKRWL
ncbi:MAG TPA: magnesium transporter CorA family protein [Gaiellaceae bacterium]|nr:magnesium transporter CorA family protein [Gaiellaceae bacterium]